MVGSLFFGWIYAIFVWRFKYTQGVKSKWIFEWKRVGEGCICINTAITTKSNNYCSTQQPTKVFNNNIFSLLLSSECCFRRVWAFCFFLSSIFILTKNTLADPFFKYVCSFVFFIFPSFGPRESHFHWFWSVLAAWILKNTNASMRVCVFFCWWLSFSAFKEFKWILCIVLHWTAHSTLPEW